MNRGTHTHVRNSSECIHATSLSFENLFCATHSKAACKWRFEEWVNKSEKCHQCVAFDAWETLRSGVAIAQRCETMERKRLYKRVERSRSAFCFLGLHVDMQTSLKTILCIRTHNSLRNRLRISHVRRLPTHILNWIKCEISSSFGSHVCVSMAVSWVSASTVPRTRTLFHLFCFHHLSLWWTK